MTSFNSGDEYFSVLELIVARDRDNNIGFNSTDVIVGGGGTFYNSLEYIVVDCEATNSLKFNIGKTDIYAWGKNKYGNVSERVNAKVLVTHILEN
jgi:hypothetical protein